MIEKIVREYLKEALDMGVYLEVPKEDAPFIVLEKTGSRKIDHIERSTIAVQSYGISMLETARLNLQMKQAMENIVELDEICDCELVSDYNFTDTDTKRYRYQAVFNITHY